MMAYLSGMWGVSCAAKSKIARIRTNGIWKSKTERIRITI